MLHRPRLPRRWGLTLAVASAAAAATAVPARVAADSTYNPCDTIGQLPQCVSALGPLVDVTARWREYQPALVQPIPMADYSSDYEDQVVGFCGTEQGTAAADGTPPPKGTVASAPPAGVPAPPSSQGPYCVLRYFAADFTAPCATCHRVLIDYSAIPDGNPTAPGADGHWAARFTTTQGLSASTTFNGHSPNIKNVCSDKFFNPAKGAACDAIPFEADFDKHSLSVEGDVARFVHFPLEGRYYNGPAYLAGDGGAVPYHWVQGAYVDIDAGATPGTVWYGVGYRGKGDPAPDTDQSYACLCEVPPLGHQAYSADYKLAPLGPQAQSSSGGGTGVAPGGTAPAPPAETTLPNTAAPAGQAAVVVAGTAMAVAALLRRRRCPPGPTRQARLRRD